MKQIILPLPTLATPLPAQDTAESGLARSVLSQLQARSIAENWE